MIKKNILFILTFIFCVTSSSQINKNTYRWGVGVKYQPIALSVKRYTSINNALEFLLIKQTEGYRVTSLFEMTPLLNPSASLRLILGPGLHLGYWEKKYQNHYSSNPVFGGDLVFGLEVKIPKIPIALQIDYQPTVDVIGNNDIYKDWGGATLRIAW